MARKTFEISEGTAIQVQAIEYKGKQRISIRQMYKKKGEKKWSPAKQGITLPKENAKEIAKRILKYADLDDDEFEKVGE
ncbi:hypothetical protein [Burkholderia phage BCSR5]|nr:hypothetical protein [Burkholderia phage BCSR5]